MLPLIQMRAAAGVYPPSASPPTELSQTESAIASATQALAIMRNATFTGQVQGFAQCDTSKGKLMHILET